MKLFLLTQTVNDEYDTFDAIVVSAESEEDAKTIPPGFNTGYGRTSHWDKSMWVPYESRDEDITAEYIGETHKPRGVILNSFNAG